MAVPTVGSNVAATGTTVAGTTVVLTLTAAAAIGDVLLVYIAQPSLGVTSVVDTQSNTWVNVRASITSIVTVNVYGCVVTKAMVSTNTITVTLSGTVQGAVAAMIQLKGVPESLIFATSGGTDINSVNANGTSTSATSTSLTTAHVDDLISILCIGTSLGGALATTDFTSGSVDSSYTKLNSAISTNGTTNVGLCLCYKTITSTNPMPAQAPTFTLNTSRSWSTRLLMFSGITARGTNGIFTRAGDAAVFASATSYEASAFAGALGKVNFADIGGNSFGVPNIPLAIGRIKYVQLVSDGLFSSEA